MFPCLSLPSFCEIVPEGLSSPSGIFVMKSYNREYIFLILISYCMSCIGFNIIMFLANSYIAVGMV